MSEWNIFIFIILCWNILLVTHGQYQIKQDIAVNLCYRDNNVCQMQLINVNLKDLLITSLGIRTYKNFVIVDYYNTNFLILI
jgi:hypothetical protein